MQCRMIKLFLPEVLEKKAKSSTMQIEYLTYSETEASRPFRNCWRRQAHTGPP